MTWDSEKPRNFHVNSYMAVIRHESLDGEFLSLGCVKSRFKPNLIYSPKMDLPPSLAGGYEKIGQLSSCCKQT